MQTSLGHLRRPEQGKQELWHAASRGTCGDLAGGDSGTGTGFVRWVLLCWAASLRVRSILLPRTGTVLDTIWSWSYS